MDFDPEKIPEILQKLLEGAGVTPPLWLTRTITWVVLVGVLLCAIWGLLYVLSKIKELAAELVPPRLNRETRRRLARRRRFAEHVENEVRRLNSEQSWSDYRFAELEAEVEAEGRRRALPFLPLLLPRTTSGLRREKSLTKAINVSRERLLLIEGDPGSGKSVALRHVAMKLAGRAKRRGLRTVIPIYINLKEIERPQDRGIDRNLIEEFTLRSLNRVSNRDVEEYLDEEFGKGLEDGSWLFLFDSFDEIPEILGSTEPDSVIRKYTRAIEDFLHGMNRCRGVVASRYFRGPGQVQWPRFRILPLSADRREELVRRADLPREIERELLGRLPLAVHQMGDQSKNPLFLGLICEHMKSGRSFPENGHAVFESYIEERLTRDSERLLRRYGLEGATVRAIAEQIAFCMAADPTLGLSPARERIPQSMSRQGLEVRSILATCMDALEFIKLARSESGSGGGKLFTFAHRRFQEYFATCFVLRIPERIRPRSLLLDGRWRETAIVICQTAPRSAFAPLLEEMWSFFKALPVEDQARLEGVQIREFPWPPGSLHVLGVLQDGFAGRMDEVPLDLRAQAGRIVASATMTGTLNDRRWALEVGGGVEPQVLSSMIRSAFSGGSRWLSEAAYRQVGRLKEVTPDIRAGVLEEMVALFLGGRFRRERHTTFVHLSRLEPAREFLHSYYLLLALPFLDLFFHAALAVCLGFLVVREGFIPLGGAVLAILLFSLSFLTYPRVALKPFVRAGAAAPLAIIGLAVSEGWGLPAVTILALLWAPTALQGARQGLLTNPFLWPALPLLPIWGKLSRWVQAGNELVRDPGGLVAGLLGALGAGLVLWGGSYLATRWSGCALALGVLVSLVAIFIGIAYLLKILFSIRDFLAWRRRAKARSVLRVDDFFEVLERLHSYKLRARFVRLVRREALLAASPEVENRVAKLALDTERGATFRKSLVDHLEEWTADADDLARRKVHIADYLDELCRLRESLRTEPIAAPLPPDKIAGAV